MPPKLLSLDRLRCPLREPFALLGLNEVEWDPSSAGSDKSDNEDTMYEQRMHALLFAATLLAARKLNESGIKPWGVEVAISEAIRRAEHILEKIDQRWPAEKASEARGMEGVDAS